MQPLVSIPEMIVKIGKGISIKREKVEGGSEVNVAHLKFTELFLQREQIDRLLKRGPGWAHTSFYDDNGDPMVRLELSAPLLDVTVSGTIRGPNDACLRLMQAQLTGVSLTLVRLGALLHGELSWVAAGDEASDVDSLLGQQCMAHWEVNDGAQMSLLDSERGKDPQADEGGGDADDPMYGQALLYVTSTAIDEQTIGASRLQSALKIGYNRAARLLEELQRQGHVGPLQQTGMREVLTTLHLSSGAAAGDSARAGP